MAVGGVTLSYLLFSALHFCQFALAIAVCALYGIDLDRARKANARPDGKWVRTPRLPLGYPDTLFWNGGRQLTGNSARFTPRSWPACRR